MGINLCCGDIIVAQQLLSTADVGADELLSADQQTAAVLEIHTARPDYVPQALGQNFRRAPILPVLRALAATASFQTL